MKKLLLLMMFVSGISVHAADADKTLVSWVILKDKNVKAGSVLTVESGRKFDGIVFAELAQAKWMAGSEMWNRTNKDQKDYLKEEADANTLVQMAIVYKDDQVTIYRNGEVYGSRKAKNIDILGKEDHFVTFGVRHTLGNGRIAGVIEDARIYDKALSQEEIKQLKPNKESSVKPFAWWDFEGEKMKDRMGRYKYSLLASGAKLSDGKLDLGRGGVVLAGSDEEVTRKTNANLEPRKYDEPYEAETPEWPANPPDNWPIYHLAHPAQASGPFDPNHALYYKGRYHLHYIYRNKWGFVFGHVSSIDMVHWKWHPTVLSPPTTGHHMFSGTAFMTKDGRAAGTYHGWGSHRNWISYALDDNMNKWSKPELMVPKGPDGKLMEWEPYFDPDIWLMDGMYYGLNGRSSRQSPTIMKSEDLKDWTYIGELLHPDYDAEKLGVERAEDISCPNIFKLGKKWVLVCISHRLGCRYMIGDFKDEQFLPEQHGLMGGSTRRYFAPESLLTKDGRRVNWAWYFGGEIKGVQSLPIELELARDETMRIKPLRELESLRDDKETLKGTVVKSGETKVLDRIKGDHVELEVLVEKTGKSGFGLNVLCNENGENGITINLNREEGLLEVRDEKSSFELKENEKLTLRVFIDATLVEVFANDRIVVMADLPRVTGAKINDRIALFSKDSDVKIDKITGWQMKSAYEGGSVFKEA